MIKVIGFDLDNTLYDHRQYVETAYREISKFVSKKYSIMEEEYFKWIFNRWLERGSSYNKIFEESYNNFSLSYFKEDIKKILEIYHGVTPELTLYKGIKNVLIEFKKWYRLVLITDGRESTQKLKINSLGIEEYFDSIYVSGQFGQDYYKPSTKIFERCLIDNKINSEEMIYIGDNPLLDYPPCVKIGITFIRLRAGEYRDIELNSDMLEIDLKSFEYLLKLVGDINEKSIRNNNN